MRGRPLTKVEINATDVEQELTALAAAIRAELHRRTDDLVGIWISSLARTCRATDCLPSAVFTKSYPMPMVETMQLPLAQIAAHHFRAVGKL